MQNKKHIGQILFNKIFIGYVLIATLLTSYHVYVQYSLAKNSVLKEMKTIEKAFYTSIANNVWHLDIEQIDANAEAIKSIQGIIGVSIISNNDEVLAQKGNLSLEDKKYTTYLNDNKSDIVFSNALIQHSFDIMQNEFSPGESLGTVTIYSSESAIYTIVKESIIFILIYTLIILIVLWVLFNYFSNKLLTQPLYQIIQATKDLNVKKYKEISLKENSSNHSELNTLVDTFNIMSQRITESFHILKKQKKDLQEANASQTNFLANISHELKTPLNSINVISSIMSKNTDKNLTEKQINNMNIINKSGKNLLSLINDILNISKLEAGEISATIEEFDIQELLIELYERMNPLAKEKNITLTQNISIQSNTILSDKKIILHVIQNLLSNAIKFSENETIHIHIKEKNSNIFINVIDSGIGIPADKIDNIFDRFKQVDGSTTRKYGGTGLGLATSKNFIELLGGELSVTSELHKGSDFQFYFPIKKEQEQSAQNEIKATKKMSVIDEVSEQHEINKILENEEKISEPTQKNVVLFNTNPITFLSLTVGLKAQDKIECISHTKVSDIIVQVKQQDPIILIIDENQSDKILVDALLTNTQHHIIALVKEQETSEKYVNISFKKPINVNEIIKYIQNK